MKTREDTMVTVEQKQEYLAAGLRQQITLLAHVIEEMEREQLGVDALAWRLRAVELGLRRLRTAANTTKEETWV
jgi:hypothetical protein